MPSVYISPILHILLKRVIHKKCNIFVWNHYLDFLRRHKNAMNLYLSLICIWSYRYDIIKVLNAQTFLLTVLYASIPD